MPTDPTVSITPETRVLDLLNAYPQLEDLLVEISPAFAKLRNPVLRRTVARVTSLQQAARVGGVSVGLLVSRLRRAVGQDELTAAAEPGSAPVAADRPEWCDPGRVSRRVDVRPIIDRGEKPIGPVLAVLRSLGPGQVCEVTAPFLPAPLIDMAREKGFESWWNSEEQEAVVVYFSRGSAGDSDSLVGLES